MKNVELALVALAVAAAIDSSSAFVAPKVFQTTAGAGIDSHSHSHSHSALSVLPPLPADIDIDATFGSGLQIQIAATTTTSSVDSITSSSSELFTYFAEKVIDASIPAIFSAAVIFFFFSQVKKANKGKFGGGDGYDDDEAFESATSISELYNDLYSSTGTGGGKSKNPLNFLGGAGPPPLPKNIGVPQKEFLKITNMNERFDAYDFSVTQATDSKAKAAADYRSKSFDRALGLALNAEPSVEGATVAEFLAPRVKAKLLRIEKEFLKEGMELVAELSKIEGTLAAVAMDAALAELGDQAEQMNEDDLKVTKVMDAEIEAKTQNKTVTVDKKDQKKTPAKQGELVKEATKLQTELKELELDFIQQVLAAVGPKRALGLRNALLGDIAVRGTGTGGLLLSQVDRRPLSALLKADETRPKSVFVMDFPGDVQASQLNELREEVTGVIRNAKPGDEALVVLQSGGGTVTGYGLAAGQLVRLKDKGLKLTIAVEQVAASGGYMMSCVADRIIASPFAVIGSIGVISEVPNVYERLTKEGIQFQTVTAGKFKRTLTPTKKITKQDLAKSEEDIAEIFELFKGWVAQNRPQLNINEVATGETWFGPAALEKGLCDEIKTVDDVILDYINGNFNVYQVKYEPPPEIPNGLAPFFASSKNDGAPRMGAGEDGGSIGRRAIRWLVRSFAEEVKAATSIDNMTPSLQKKYMAQDDTMDRVKASLDDTYDY